MDEGEAPKAIPDYIGEALSQRVDRYYASLEGKKLKREKAVKDAFFEGAMHMHQISEIAKETMKATMEGMVDQNLKIEVAPTKVNHVFPRVGAGCYTLNLGNGTLFQVMLLNYIGEWFYLSIMGIGCYRFQSYVHRSYVQEKLKVCASDAANISDFLNDVMEISSERQGVYEDRYCVGEN